MMRQYMILTFSILLKSTMINHDHHHNIAKHIITTIKNIEIIIMAIILIMNNDHVNL